MATEPGIGHLLNVRPKMKPPRSGSRDRVPARNYAAIYAAVGWLRGALYDVLDGNVDKEHIQRLIDATGTANIEKVIGARRNTLSIDHNRYLTEKEKEAIGGAPWANDTANEDQA